MNDRMKHLSKIMLVAGFFKAMTWHQPVYKKYKLEGKGYLKTIKIVFLSDLHNSIYGTHQSKLIKMIDQVKPDIVIAGGDMSDEKTLMSGSIELFEELCDKYPIYYVSGNHEHWMDKSDEIFNVFEELGMQRLENEAIQLTINNESVTLIGVNDPDSRLNYRAKDLLKSEIDEAMGDVTEEGYRILVSHRPEHIGLYKDYELDLVLSGHAHGGQVRIPRLLNGLYAPNQGFFPKYAGGYYHVNDQLDFVVGRGLSHKRKLPRIFNPPEVVVIEFN